jgi:protein-tyrosine kinase
MDSIWQAVERARNRPAGTDPRNRAASTTPAHYRSQEVLLSNDHLQTKRIIAHLNTDMRSRPFDMLRTQVLQTMDTNGWKTLAVTSPTPSCGKTLTASNLTLSIARQPEKSVLLVDLDFRKPHVANCLGLKCEEGIVGVLEVRTTLDDEIIPARIGNLQFLALPTASTIGSSEIIASRAMVALLEDLKRFYPTQTIIFDLPPILAGDDVISILPHIDCALFVTAVGTTTISQIEECRKHLRATHVVRVVLNKVPESSTSYHYYY